MFLLPFSLACFVAFAACVLLDFRQIAIPMGVLTSNTELGCDFFGRCGAIAGCHEFSAIGKCNTQKQGPQKMQNTKTRKNALFYVFAFSAKTLFFCNFQFNFPTLKHFFFGWIVLGRFNPSEKKSPAMRSRPKSSESSKIFRRKFFTPPNHNPKSGNARSQGTKKPQNGPKAA